MSPYDPPQTGTPEYKRDNGRILVGIAAGFLNFLCFGGLGYLLLGQWQKAIIAIVSTFLLSCFGLGILLAPITALDAIVLGALEAQGRRVAVWETFGLFSDGPPVPDRMEGRAVAVVIVVLMVCMIPIVGITTAIAIPNFISMQQRAKRAEVPANVDGLRTAVLAYEAVEGTRPPLCGPAPRAVDRLDRDPVDWVAEPCFDELGWAPDGQVRGTYQIMHTDAGWEIYGWIDVDGDGQPSTYMADQDHFAQMITDNLVY